MGAGQKSGDRLIFIVFSHVFDWLDLCHICRANRRLFGNPGIDEEERLADAFNIQRAMHYVFKNKDMAGIMDW
jgi:hypothetical protein